MSSTDCLNVARMQRSGIREPRNEEVPPDSAALHPGYEIHNAVARQKRIRPDKPAVSRSRAMLS